MQSASISSTERSSCGEDHPIGVAGDVFVADRKRHRFLKQRDKPVRTDSLTPFRQRRGVQRHLVLHRFEPAEVLPVRILHPAFQQ